jgi:hypothetical protein
MHMYWDVQAVGFVKLNWLYINCHSFFPFLLAVLTTQ